MKIPCAAAVVLACLSAGGEQAKPSGPASHTIVRGDELQWKPLRPGAELAVVSGDPDGSGTPFVIRFRYRGDVKVPPHWHPTDEHITVLSGTFAVGMGERFEEASLTPLQAGAYMRVPVKMAHYAASRGDAVVQVHGIGPFAINYVNPADDPRKKQVATSAGGR
jgi:mannose-6-phosphate isomerase-like protein (cupin superfamily)